MYKVKSAVDSSNSANIMIAESTELKEGSVTGAADNSSQILSSASSSSLSALTGKNLVSSLLSNIYSIIITFRPKETLNNSTSKIVWAIIFHVYLIYNSIVVSSFPIPYSRQDESKLWGYIPSWIWRVLFFPMNFGCEFYPYEAIVALSIIFLVLEVATLVGLYWCKWASKKGGKLYEKVKQIIQAVVVFYRTFSIFVIYIHSLLLSPNISDMTSYYYPTVSFSETSNIVFACIGVIGTLLTVVITILGIYLTSETIPPTSYKSFFSLALIYPFCSLMVTNQLSVIANIVCNERFSFISSIVKIILNMVVFFLMFRTFPFFRKWENCFYLGVVGSKILAPIVPLVLHFVKGNDIIGGSLTGVTFVAALIGFVLAGLISYVYSSLHLRHIRKILDSKSEASNTLHSKDLQHSVSLFLRFSLTATRKEDIEGSDFDFAKFFVLHHGKNMSSAEMLITCSLFIAFGQLEGYDRTQACALGLACLQKAAKNSPNQIQIFHIMLRMEELEHLAFQGNNLEVLRRLETLEKKVKILGRAHKTFFKELLNENPKITKLENINRTCCVLYTECDKIYENLLNMSRNNRALLKSYASYLEKYKWEYQLAQEFYEEAQDAEEDKKTTQIILKPRRKSVKVEPTESNRRFSITNTSYMNNDDNWDSVSCAAEENEDRKDNIIRSAINTPMNTVIYSLSFILFSLISVIALAIIAPMALSYSATIDMRMSMQEKVCLMSGVPYKMLSQIKALQSEHALRGYITSQMKNSTYTQTNLMLDLTEEVISAGSNGKLMPEVVQAYLSSDYVVSIPIKNYSLENTSTIPEYSQTNTSLAFYMGTILAQGRNLLLQFENLETLTTHLDNNYPFLFFYYNRMVMTNAFSKFCTTFVNASVDSLDQNFNSLLIASCSVIGVYLLLAICYLLVMSMHTKRIAMEIKGVFKKIPKDEIGKVYHCFDKKLDDTMNSLNSSLLKPNRLIILSGCVTILVVCIGIVLVLVEYKLNSDRASLSMKNLSIINSVLYRVASVNFRVNEMIQRSKYSQLTTFNQLRDSSLTDIQAIQKYWYSIILGNENSGYQSAVVGKYTDIDAQLTNSCNDTLVMNFANTTTDNLCFGLNDFITEFISRSTELNEEAFKQSDSTSDLTTRYIDRVFYLSQVLTEQLLQFVSKFVAHEKKAQMYITATSISVTVVVVVVMGVLCFNSLLSFWKERFCLRMLLNYLNMEVIENTFILKEYVISNTVSFSNSTTKIIGKLNKIHSEDSSAGDESIMMVKTVLNGGVDASILCNKEGNITIFNNSAEEMFGYARADVLGDSIQTLFTEEYASRLTKLMSVDSTCKADTFEVMGLRKNKSTFHSKVSVSVTNYDKKPMLIAFIRDITPEKKQNMLICEEKKKSEDLLLNILPQAMASRLKNGETNLYEKFNDISVFFSDMVGFTSMSSGMQPSELVQMLNLIVQGYDKLTEVHGIDKIKTIGDAYFCVGGLHTSKTSDHPEKMLSFSIDVMSFLRKTNSTTNKPVNIRAGIHTGEAVAGVIGFKKFAYDLWGDTINTASRMESTGVPGRIQISRATYERVYDLGYEFEEREQEVKGKGKMKCYLLASKHHENPMDFEVIESNIRIYQSTEFLSLKDANNNKDLTN